MYTETPVTKPHKNNIPLNVKLFQDQAIIYSTELGLDHFTTSNVWHQTFQNRHGTKAAILSGKAADVSMATIDGWKNVLLPSVKDIKISYSKECITVMASCSAAGEKLQMFVIGKSAKLRFSTWVRWLKQVLRK